MKKNEIAGLSLEELKKQRLTISKEASIIERRIQIIENSKNIEKQNLFIGRCFRLDKKTFCKVESRPHNFISIFVGTVLHVEKGNVENILFNESIGLSLVKEKNEISFDEFNDLLRNAMKSIENKINQCQ